MIIPRSKSLRVTLPDDLIAEVLSFLDVKSLMRLKCVSKPWKSLISKPFFVKMHLDKSSTNPHITLFYLCDQILELNHFPVRHLLESEPIAFTNNQLTSQECYKIVGFCNGLISLLVHSPIAKYRNHSFYQDFSLCFWNPATRSLSTRLGSFSISIDDPYFKFSFGYDTLNEKYKVVAFRPKEVRVFTLGNNEWRNIQSFPTDPYHYTNDLQNYGFYFSNSLYWFALRDNTHSSYSWWKDRIHTVDQCVIISLDLETEKYTHLLPPRNFDEVPRVMPIICVLMNCLCFCHYSKPNDFITWQMREFRIEESRTKLFKFSYHDPQHYYGYDGYCSLFPLHVFVKDDTLILGGSEGQLIRYNRRDNSVEKTGINNDIYWFHGKVYVESLVLI